MDKSKIWKMVAILTAIVIIASSLSKLASRNSLSLSEYAALHASSDTDYASPDTDFGEEGQAQSPPTDTAPSDLNGKYGQNISSPAAEDEESPSSAPENAESASQLTGAALNGACFLEQRILLAEGFYYEPISDRLKRYMTGISYPAAPEKNPDMQKPDFDVQKPDSDMQEPDSDMQEPNFDDFRYVHILHYDFDGNSTEGELICNASIAQDLVEIFYELYCNEYKLEKVLLIDEYDGDEAASAQDNNSSCFRYSAQENSHASRHAQGLAVDINPLYNPYITYAQDGFEQIMPESSCAYADRSASFPYKIDEDDLCYKLFIRHGFTWGGNWNDAKGYQHFQKAPADGR